jgi:DNA-binding beta-propeller fold protein YncE
MVFDVAPSRISNGEDAENVLGASDFTSDNYSHSSSQNGLSNPVGLAYDASNNRLFVVDSYEADRVVVFDVSTSTIRNGEDAENVLGEPDFSSANTTCIVTQALLCNPAGATYDPTSGRLFVSDSSNSRIMVFDAATSTIKDGEDAEYVFGQSDFTSNGAATTQNGLIGPKGLAYDPTGQRLFVADSNNNRVMVFDASSAMMNGEDAEDVIGQINFNARVGATTQSGFSSPSGLAYDPIGQNLFVTDIFNNRVMEFAGTPILSISLSSSTSPSLSSLTFTASLAATSTNEGKQDVTLENTGAGTLNWTSTSSEPWLTFDTASGSLAFGATTTIGFFVDPFSLSTGTYNATATIADPNAGNSPQTVSVTLTVNPPRPSSISLSPSSLVYATSLNSTSTNEGKQDVTLENTGAGTLNWTATSSEPWLSFDTASGSLASGSNTNIGFLVDPSSLSASVGTYNATATIADPNAGNSPQTVSVTLTVNPPTISLSSSSLSYTAGINATSTNEGTQDVTLENTGDGTLNWTATSSAPWLTFDAASGSIGSGSSTNIGFLVDPSSLGAGAYNATATISDPNAANSPQTVSVALTVYKPNSIVWTNQTSSESVFWGPIASSANARKLAVAGEGMVGLFGLPAGDIFTSSDGGLTWTDQTSTGSRYWSSIVSSEDGLRLAATEGFRGSFGSFIGGDIFTSSDGGLTWTDQAAAGSGYWAGIASSANGTKLAAVAGGLTGLLTQTPGDIFTSPDGGATWIDQTSTGSRYWSSITASADGMRLAAAEGFRGSFGGLSGGDIFTSSDGGLTWTDQTSTAGRYWTSITSSADGMKLAATAVQMQLNGDFAISGGDIFTSSDGGLTWTDQAVAGSRVWGIITSSADGTKLAAAVGGPWGFVELLSHAGGTGDIYVSTDSGLTWTDETSAGSGLWWDITSSADGTRLAATNIANLGSVGMTGNIWTGFLPTYAVGGTISGLTGTVSLEDNATDTLTTSSSSFTFPTTLESGATYAVTVSSQPSGETCTVMNGVDTIGSVNVTNISISCSPNTPPIIVSVPAGYAVGTQPGNQGPTPNPAPPPPPAPTPTPAPAPSATSLTAEIASLQAELAALEARTGQSTIGPSAPSVPAYVFTRNLSLWTSGNDVKELQQFLIAENSGPAAGKLKTHGATKIFGPLTYNALVELQRKAGITPVSGYFGPKTRAWVNARE